MRHPFRKPSVILSLILLAACVVFWHRGNRQRESFSYYSATLDAQIELSTIAGDIVFAYEGPQNRLVWFDLMSPDGWTAERLQGFSASHGDARSILTVLNVGTGGVRHALLNDRIELESGPGYRFLRFPWWILILILSMLPFRALLLALRIRKRKRQNLCVHCGYDLRHSKDRCPECGTAISPADENSPKIESPVAS